MNVLILTLLIFLAEAVPKRILDLMNVEGLTRENVASHLQALIFPFCRRIMIKFHSRQLLS